MNRIKYLIAALILGITGIATATEAWTEYVTVGTGMRIYPDYFTFSTSANSPCGEAAFVVKRDMVANYDEVLFTVRDARHNSTRVDVVSDGCWSLNPQMGVVTAVHPR